MRRGFVDTRYGQIHYRTEGAGEPLLLLHQTLSSSASFSQMFPLLSQSYHVLSMDYPGCGDSDAGPRQFEIQDYAGSILAFLDAMAIKKTHVVGDFTGASVGVELAASRPDRVDRLILLGCPYWKYEANRLQCFELEEFQPLEPKQDGSHLLEIWQWVSEGVELVEEVQRGTIDYLKAQAAPKRGQEGHYALFQYDVQPRLSLIQSPTLVLTTPGEIFHRRATDVHRLISESKVVVLDEGDQWLSRQRPGKFAEAVLAFLDA